MARKKPVGYQRARGLFGGVDAVAIRLLERALALGSARGDDDALEASIRLRTERPRQNVTRTIAAAIKKIAAGNPALGTHLAATIRTGTSCSYRPDARRVLTWTL